MKWNFRLNFLDIEIALFLSKEVDLIEPYHLILSFEISYISSGKWCRNEPDFKELTSMVRKFSEIPVESREK